uniref:MARVEL domain-containing protein 3-like protein n=1 Tax=Callorhinchus milii TaxID=7868 RepID=K4FXV0_CALMI|nr:MARVEL domain-containing protein 3-like protein [Callorhinchus milii]
MSNANRTARSQPSNRPHRERRHQDRANGDRNHSNRHAGEGHRESRQNKPHPSRQSYSSNERLSQVPPDESYTRPSTARPPPSEHFRDPPSSSPPDYSSASQSNYPPKESSGSKCSYLCTRRGVLQFSELITNLMVLICIAASHVAISGYTSMGGLGAGAFSIDSAYSPFQGTELKQVRELDMQYSQMRAPGVYGGVAFTIVVGSLTLLFLVGGAKPPHRLSFKLLTGEVVFNVLACIGYIIAVGLYLHLIIKVNGTEICRLRYRLYAGRGYTFMNCDVQGGDASVALFGLISACLYCGSAVVSFLTLRKVKALNNNNNNNNPCI